MAGTEVVDRDRAGIDQFGDVGVVAADQHGGGLAGRGFDLVESPDDRHGESGGLQRHAGRQVGDALGAAARNDDHIDCARDLSAAQKPAGGVHVGEVEIALGAPAATGSRARARLCGQRGKDDLPSRGLEGERSQIPKAQLGGIGAGRAIADPLPRQDLQAVEGVPGLGGARIVGECEVGGEVDVGGAVGQGGLLEGEGGGGGGAVAAAEPGGELVGHVGQRGTGEIADVWQGPGEMAGGAQQGFVVASEDGDPASAVGGGEGGNGGWWVRGGGRRRVGIGVGGYGIRFRVGVRYRLGIRVRGISPRVRLGGVRRWRDGQAEVGG